MCVCGNPAKSQGNIIAATSKETFTHTYYLDIRGVDTKPQCVALIELIHTKKGVSFFETQGFPQKYFLLKTDIPVTEDEVRGWISGVAAQLVFFAEGEKGLERMLYNKTHH